MTLLLFYSLYFSLLFHSVFGFSDFEWVILLPLFLNSPLALSPFIPLSRTISLSLSDAISTYLSLSLSFTLPTAHYLLLLFHISLFLSLTFNLSTTLFLFLSLPLALFPSISWIQPLISLFSTSFSLPLSFNTSS